MVWNTSPVLPVLSWDLRFHEEIGKIEEEKKASSALVLTKKIRCPCVLLSKSSSSGSNIGVFYQHRNCTIIIYDCYFYFFVVGLLWLSQTGQTGMLRQQSSIARSQHVGPQPRASERASEDLSHEALAEERL